MPEHLFPSARHTVVSYEQELRHLRDLLTRMGGLVEHALALATRAMVEHDEDAAIVAIEGDATVDGLEREAEALVIRMLALRQPMARDLREIVAALKMTSDLERIGDYAANVAKRSRVLQQAGHNVPLGGLGQMARLVQESLKLIIDAVGDGDAGKALRVWQADQEIDDLYTAVFRELITYMMEDPRHITPCTHLMFIAKNLERIGDHATNIAETVHYAATGTMLGEARPKGESSAFSMPPRFLEN